mgnify:CR=1 FL=1
MQINDEYDEDNDDKKQHFSTSFGILNIYIKRTALFDGAVLVVVRFIVLMGCFYAQMADKSDFFPLKIKK